MKKMILISTVFVFTLALLCGCGSNSKTSAESIGIDKAKEIALADAGISQSDAVKLKAELEKEGGRDIYDVSFDSAGYEYDYDIDAATGEIIHSDKDVDDDYIAPDNRSVANDTESTPAAKTDNTPSDSTDFISYDKAKEIALADAGISQSDAVKLKAELEREGGRDIYDVSFDSAGYEYDYDIDAATGEIIHSDKDVDDDYIAPDNRSVANDTESTPAAKTDNTPSDSTDFISYDKAKEIALADAGISQADAVKLKAELEREGGRDIYDVSFDSAGYEYDYDIDAVTGEIIRSDKDIDDDYVAPNNQSSAGQSSQNKDYITKDKAMEIALGHAGVAKNDTVKLEAELEREGGRDIYDVSFDSAGYEYDYDIDAVTGEIIRSDKDIDDDYVAPANQSSAGQSSQNKDYITKDKAMEIALGHAGVAKNDTVKLEAELEKEGGRDIYDVSFDSAGYEYDYDIDAVTGEIIRSDKDVDDDYVAPTNRTSDNTQFISYDKAKEIALADAGVAKNDALKLKAELEREGGRDIYDVSFDSAGYEYDYEIDAVTGDIIKRDKERDD